MNTPLETLHRLYGGKMSTFAGWELPMQFSGPLEEHRWVREKAGIFDISHMGRIRVQGPSAAIYFETFTTINAQDLTAGRARYGLVLDIQGRIVDDVYLFRLGPEDFLFVVNAANRETILEEFFLHHPQKGTLTYQDITFDSIMIALQGPESGEVWKKIGGGTLPEERNEVWLDKNLIVSRTGYTGEFGIEVILPITEGLGLWEDLLSDPRVKPIGLAARDSLRFEAGYMLYGHELDRTLRPQDTSLGWAIRKKRLELLRGVESFQNMPPKYRLLWFTMEEKAVPRQGYPVFDSAGETKLGSISSGMYSPTNDIFAGNARVNWDFEGKPGDPISIEIRGVKKAARVIAPPLYPGGTQKKE